MKNEVEMNESQPRQTTRWTRRRMMCGLAAVAAAVYTEMRFVEPNWLGLGVHRVPLLPAGSERIRILQISDLHASDDMRGLHQWQNHWLHITKGVASIRNMRLNCFPEISMVELVPMA